MRFSIVTAYMSQIEMTIDLLDRLQEMKTDDENIEVIVVNAGGQPIYHPFINKRVDLPKNHSFSNSMNAGIREATADFIVVLNNDGFPTQKGWLTKLYGYWNRTKAMIVCPNNTRPGLMAYNHSLVENKDDYTIMEMFPAICYFLPRSTIQTIGYFDERFIPAYYEDNDYCKRVTNVGGKIIVTKDIYIDHLLSKESSSANIDINAAMKINYKRFVEKWKLSSLVDSIDIMRDVKYMSESNIEYVIETLKKIRFTGEDFKWHWGFVNWKNKSILDLGADIGSTAECFLDAGSNKVIAVEGNKNLYDQLSKYAKTNQMTVPIHRYIANKDDFIYLFSLYSDFVDIVKIDIEGAEIFLLELPDDILKSIKEYAIECHSNDILKDVSNMFNNLGFKIATTKFLTTDISVIHAINKSKLIS